MIAQTEQAGFCLLADALFLQITSIGDPYTLTPCLKHGADTEQDDRIELCTVLYMVCFDKPPIWPPPDFRFHIRRADSGTRTKTRTVPGELRNTRRAFLSNLPWMSRV